jgi:hypothetical protein
MADIKDYPSYLDYPKERKKQTNGNRIRAMSDEELAEFLWSIGQSPFSGNVYLNGKLIFFSGDGNGWLDWLKEEND